VSQANVELLRPFFDAWNRGEMSDEWVRSVWHPDVEFMPLRSATEGPYRGIDGIERFIADTQEVFEKFETHYEYLDLGERLLVGGTIRVRGAGSGVETDIPAWSVVEFGDGKVLRWEAFGSKAEALRSAGLEG
jgi:ketosteroid isomerase-like protein